MLHNYSYCTIILSEFGYNELVNVIYMCANKAKAPQYVHYESKRSTTDMVFSTYLYLWMMALKARPLCQLLAKSVILTFMYLKNI